MRKNMEVKCRDIIEAFFRHMSEVTEDDREDSYRNLTTGIFERHSY
jgi:hypothetical protein